MGIRDIMMDNMIQTNRRKKKSCPATNSQNKTQKRKRTHEL